MRRRRRRRRRLGQRRQCRHDGDRGGQGEEGEGGLWGRVAGWLGGSAVVAGVLGVTPPPLGASIARRPMQAISVIGRERAARERRPANAPAARRMRPRWPAAPRRPLLHSCPPRAAATSHLFTMLFMVAGGARLAFGGRRASEEWRCAAPFCVHTHSLPSRRPRARRPPSSPCRPTRSSSNPGSAPPTAPAMAS